MTDLLAALLIILLMVLWLAVLPTIGALWIVGALP